MPQSQEEREALRAVQEQKRARQQALQQAFGPSRPMEPGDYYSAKRAAENAAIAEGRVPQTPAFPSLQDAYAANKPNLDEQRKAFEEQRAQDPYHWDGRGMPRFLSQDEKRKLVNGE